MIIKRETPLKVGDMVRVTIPARRDIETCPSGVNDRMLAWQGKIAQITMVFPFHGHTVYHIRTAEMKGIWNWNDSMLTEITDFELDADKAVSLI